MDEQDRENDILKAVTDRLRAISLSHDRQYFDTNDATEKLQAAFNNLKRREKERVRQQLDRGSLSRRDFLKLLGVSVGTAATIGFIPALREEISVRTPTGYAHANVDLSGDVDVQEGRGYEIWTPSGHVNADIASGSTVENVLIDQSGGGSVSFRASSNGWTLRNVGWRGIADSTHEGGRFAFLSRLSVPGGDASATVDSIFMEGWGTSMGGMWLRPNHAGTIIVQNSYFAGFGNNSIYGSGPGKNGHDNGNILVESSVSNSSTTGNFRVSGQGSRVRNSFITLNDPNCNRGHYPGNPDSYGGRPIAARHWDDIAAENCSVYVNPDDCNSSGAYQAWHCGGGCNSNGSQTVLNVRECRINENAPNKIGEYNGGTVNVEGSLQPDPTLDVLHSGGVPASPEDAARGNLGVPDSINEFNGQPRQEDIAVPGLGGDTGGTDSSEQPC